jgi:hypothetical protein
MFSKLPADEIERRRNLSITAFDGIKRAEFEAWYQEQCDSFYWKNGRCCAGCDHWSSSEAWIGQCMSAPPVSGADVIRSMGINWSSYNPPPGQPYTKRDHVCGAFKDEFDWSTLDESYLRKIGAPLTKSP